MLSDLIRVNSAELSRTDRRVAEHLLQHLEEVPFLRAAEVADQLEVSAASVTRFAQRLGFDGYPHLQDEVRRDLRAALTVSAQPVENERRFARLWERELRNLEQLRELPEDVLVEASRTISEAKTVWVLGGGASQAPAGMLAYSLGMVRSAVRSLTPAALHDSQPLLDLAPDDLLVAFTFRRYARTTAQIGQLFIGCSVPVLLVTDDGSPSLAEAAKVVLRVSCRAPAALPSMTAVASLTMALTLGVIGFRGSDRLNAGEGLRKTLDMFEG
jgi:DNA-binding MurR/RpiR family transcriptional regulator